MSASPRCWFAVLAMVVLSASTSCIPLIASAQNVAGWQQMVQPHGAHVQLPVGLPTSRDSGLILSVDTRWVNNYGYRPVHVAVQSPAPATADHVITIRLRSSWWSRRRGDIAIEQDIELPMGSTSAEATVACPQYQLAVQAFWWDVWVDGVRDEDLSLDLVTALNAMGGTMAPGASARYTALVIGPTSRRRELLVDSPDLAVLAVPEAELPIRWIDYTCLDIVSLSVGQLRQLAEVNPDALVAIRRWVQAGGQLWVEEVGGQWEELPVLDQTLQLGSAGAASVAGQTDTASDDEVVGDGWRSIGSPDGRRRRAESFVELSTGVEIMLRDPEAIARLRRDPDYAEINSPDGPGDSDGDRWRDSHRWILEKPLGLGQVRAFSRPWDSTGLAISRRSGVVGDLANTGSISRAVLSEALRWTPDWGSRHGLIPNEANTDFSRLLVPGLGLAPVTEFRVLITLFVLVIGPLNYWLLKRRERVQLIVLTVPAAAGIVTLGLFAYALISDGLSTTVRVRSLTTLDQRTGDAACWARLSYYSGMAPRSGLSMSNDSVVYPINPGWKETDDGTAIAGRRTLEWNNQAARLASGWLKSRTPTQYLSIRSRVSPHRLQLDSAPTMMRATNKLGADIVYVVAVDGDGNMFTGEHIAAGATVRLLPASRSEAMGNWRRLVVENDPEPPPGLEGDDWELVRAQQRRRRRVMQQTLGRFDYSGYRLSDNLPNEMIADLAGLEGDAGLELPRRSYLAVTKAGPEVELGVPGATEESSFHVLVGKW